MNNPGQSIENSIKRQLDSNKSKNLLFEDVTQIMNVDSSFLTALEEFLNCEMTAKLEDFHSELTGFATRELVKRLYSINPYLRVSQAQIENLRQIYRQSWQALRKTRNVQATLQEFHYPALSKWLATLYPEEFQKALKFSSRVGNVTYGEYSAALQIELLGIDIGQVKPPIIDIGCGRQASLTTYFRSLGVEAYGIDRYLDIHEPYTEQVDWFDYRFEPNRWGTIVAHMSFTNHLRYAYLNDNSQLERYLSKMTELVESLLLGGSFHYAPSLPFIEDRLTMGTCRVQRESKISNMLVSTIVKTQRSKDTA